MSVQMSLLEAVENGDSVLVQQHLEQGVDSNELNEALREASGRGHSDVVKLLLDSGAQVNLQDIDGWSSLRVASENGHSYVVKLLLDSGAQVNLRDREGSSSLMLASENGYSDVVKLLLDNDAQVNLWNKNGDSALDLACEPEIIDLLVGRREEMKMDSMGEAFSPYIVI